MPISVTRYPLGVSEDTSLFELGPDKQLEPLSVAEKAANLDTEITLSRSGASEVKKAHQTFQKSVEAGHEIYGTTTGFGPFVKFASSGRHCDEQGKNLIAHLGAGSGDASPLWIVRITQIIRANTIAQGRSGTHPEVLGKYLSLFNGKYVPRVPRLGSLGASGDLVPLAHIVRGLTGESSMALAKEETLFKDRPDPSIFTEDTPFPAKLGSRDALSMVNGTSFSTAWLVAGLYQANALLEYAETLSGWLYASIGARPEALDERLHSARGHPNQVHSALSIAEGCLRFSPTEPQLRDRALQEIYSIRCAPQVLGACRDNLDFAYQRLDHEINGVSDNPILDTNRKIAEPLHGGNFFAQQIAFAADLLNMAIVQMATLAERQLDALLNPQVNNNAPLLLAYNPGATSGLAGAQITATAVLAEMRQHAYPGSITSIPTNGSNQDIVPMAANAARNAYDQCSNLATILAVLARGLEQYRFLAQERKVDVVATPRPHLCADLEPLVKDRALDQEIETLQQRLLLSSIQGEDPFRI